MTWGHGLFGWGAARKTYDEKRFRVQKLSRYQERNGKGITHLSRTSDEKAVLSWATWKHVLRSTMRVRRKARLGSSRVPFSCRDDDERRKRKQWVASSRADGPVETFDTSTAIKDHHACIVKRKGPRPQTFANDVLDLPMIGSPTPREGLSSRSYRARIAAI